MDPYDLAWPADMLFQLHACTQYKITGIKAVVYHEMVISDRAVELSHTFTVFAM